MKIRFAFIFIPTLLLAACAGVTPSASTPAATTEPITTETSEMPAAGEALIPEAGPRPVMSGNRAVIALLDRAEVDSRTGKREAAGASLERALRIEPRNPWLWLELAQVRLAEGQYAQSITLARKANSFAGRQPRLLTESWQVIGKARVAQGDTAGAEQAFKLAAEFAQQARQP